MKNVILLFMLCIMLSSCSSKYTISGVRNSNVSIEELKTMNYKINKTSVKYNDQKNRPFAVEEEGFILALNKGMKKNFYKKSKPNEEKTMNLSIKIVTNDKHEIIPHCSKTDGMHYGYYHPIRIGGWLFGLGGIGAGGTTTTACQEDNTYYDVTITGAQDDKNDVLFETKLNYKGNMVNTKKRNKELKNMIDKATKHIGANIADRIKR